MVSAQVFYCLLIIFSSIMCVAVERLLDHVVWRQSQWHWGGRRQWAGPKCLQQVRQTCSGSQSISGTCRRSHLPSGLAVGQDRRTVSCTCPKHIHTLRGEITHSLYVWLGPERPGKWLFSKLCFSVFCIYFCVKQRMRFTVELIVSIIS